MENRDEQDEGGQGPPGKPDQSGGQTGSESGRENQGGDKESPRPSPSVVPNEGRGRENQQAQDQGGRQGVRRYSFKGGLPAHGIPHPDDPDDDESAGTPDQPGAGGDKPRNPA